MITPEQIAELIKTEKAIARLKDKAFGSGSITLEQYQKRVKPLSAKYKELNTLLNKG